MSDPSPPGGPFRSPDPDEPRDHEADTGQARADSADPDREAASPPNTAWSAPQGGWEPPSAPGSGWGPPPQAGLGWGPPPPQAGWSQLPEGGWSPPPPPQPTWIAPPPPQATWGAPPPPQATWGASRAGAQRRPSLPGASRRRHRFSRIAVSLLLVATAAFLGVAISQDFWQSNAGTASPGQSRRGLRGDRLRQSALRRWQRLGFGGLVVRLGIVGLRVVDRRDLDRLDRRPALVDINVTLGYQSGQAAATGIVLNVLGPRAHQQPRGHGRDQPQRHRRGQRTDLLGDRAGLRPQPRHRPDPVERRVRPQDGAARRLLQGHGRPGGGRPGQRRRRRRHAQRGRRLGRGARSADHGQRRRAPAPRNSSPA